MKKLLVLVIIAVYSISFASSSGSSAANAVVSIIHSPQMATTDSTGAFTVSAALSGQVTDTSSILPLPIAGVVVTLPYYSKTLTATSDDEGKYTTDKISFSGTVVDTNNKPISGAWVSIRPQAVLDTSDNSGMLKNGGSVGTVFPFSRMHRMQPGALLTGNRLIIASAGDFPINISLFTAKGRVLFSASLNNLKEGSHRIKLPQLPAGFYLLKASGAGFTAVFKKVSFSNNNLIVERRQSLIRSASAMIEKTASALFSDTLVAFADGYHVGYAAVPSGSTAAIKIVLKKSNMWKPSGSGEIERKGSMVLIKAKGHDFSMGQPVMLTDDIFLINWGDEAPAHAVSFSYDFWMDTTEVTQKQYMDVMSAAYPNFRTPEWKPTYGVGDNIASYSMSLGDAILYCNARSNAESLDTVYSYTGVTGNAGQHCELKGLRCNYFKNGYRLPTEAEWEYACRGGTVTDFYWGKNYLSYPSTSADTAEISGYASWAVTSTKSSTDPDYASKKGVAAKKPNGYGLYDMAGGLLEYTLPADLYYTHDAVEDPKPLPTDTDIYPVLRGGNWGNGAAYLRSSCRKWACTGNYDYWFLGFRTVREVIEE